MSRYNLLHCAGVATLLVLLSACSSSPGGNRPVLDNPYQHAAADSQVTVPLRKPASERSVAQAQKAEVTAITRGHALNQQAEIYRGSGALVNLRGAPATTDNTAEGEITLNFQDTEIGEVVKTILGDILGENYVLDDGVRGTVYLQTARPLRRDELIPALEKMLQVKGALLVRNRNFYEVIPASATPGALSPTRRLQSGDGFQLLLIPLRYIAAREMVKILEPLKPRQGVLEADSRRNLLTVAGTAEELINIRETVRVFDVDQLKGMSVGLFRLQSVDAEVLVDELELIFGDEAEGPLAGLVRFMPIERLNALLVMTPQRKYLSDVRQWINRLDRAGNSRGLNMYVYYVQNGKADTLAQILSELFEGQREQRPERSETVTTGNTAVEGATATSTTTAATTATSEGASLDVGEVSIIADVENNALLIRATPDDYDKVLKAVEKLDILPLQVLVEATIVEVTLADELRYGLQWFFKTALDNKSGRGTVGSFPVVTPDDFFPSASFEVFDATGTRLLLNALAEDSRLNVISSPSLMVLDNHTATIRVGDQVPVRTSETTATGSDNLNTTSTIQFRDTGVLLEVTPRVNAGGMVILDIKQEVNDVDTTTTSGIDSPTIIQRQIDTSVAVQSGETLVLGGLIKENRNISGSGLPGVRHVPVLGWLFGSEGKSVSRTELVVMITPTAVMDREQAREVTREYRDKLQDVRFSEGS